MSGEKTVINDAEKAYELVVDAIVTQRLAPSQKVSEKIICDQFSISRFVAHNLIEHLIAKKFLKPVSQRVTIVAPLTLMEVKQNFALRKLLLPEMISLAAANVNYDELYALNDQICAMMPISDDDSALQLLKLNKQLNLSIIEKLGYPLLMDWSSQLEDMTMRIYWLYLKTHNDFPYSGEQQRNTFNIMKNGSPLDAQNVILKALEQTEERIIRAIFSHEQFYTQDLKL